MVADLNASGLKVDDAVDYFTSFASEANYATFEGKMKEVTEASSRLPGLLSGAFSKDLVGPLTEEQQQFAKFFDENGDVLSDAIAEYFGGEDGGISPETRAEIERLIKQIHDGKLSVKNALKQFELFSVQSTLDIYIGEVQTNFKDVFVDLEEADGLVNTFEELGEAIGSAAGALDVFNQAQAEMAHSGHVSIETALQLMEYTDDYSSVLQVVDGKLQLAKGAEDALIDARIEKIKISAQAALSEAQLAYDTANQAVVEYQTAMATTESSNLTATAWDYVLAKAAGFAAGIKSLFTDKSWNDAYDEAYNGALSKANGTELKYDDAGLQALIDARNEAAKVVTEAQGNADIANLLTKENLESVYSSEEASGGADDPDEVKDNAFQREMDYWENRIGANQAKYEQLQNVIDLWEAKGQKADASFYEEQIKLENERLWLLEQQKSAAEAHLAAFTEGSGEWWEVANTLNDIEGELDDVTASIVDLQDAIGEIDAYKFEEFNTRLDNITNKLATIRDLIAPNGEEDWFDDEGQWTEEGVAVLGAHIQELEFDKEGLKKAQDELNKYSFSYGGNEAYYESLGIHSEQEYYDKVEELTDQQYQYLESINDTKQSVVDMYESNIDAVEEYTESLIDSYNDYIDSVKEALDAERDLYDFKKNVQKQSKDIAAIERRIASLSGSTNASDIAERRKLEAELYESRESLNDTYIDHARSTQDEALGAEQTAYEESMTKFVEGLRVSLDQATTNMDEFLMGVTSMVMYNADTVLTKYQETNLPLTGELTNPWIKAKEAVGTYSGDALDLMNKWTEEGGFFAQFNETGTKNLQSPWAAGSDAAGDFKTSIDTVMDDVVDKIATNVQSASTSLSDLYQQILDIEKRAAEADVTVNDDTDNNTENTDKTNNTKTETPKTVSATAYLQTALGLFSATGTGVDVSAAQKAAKDAVIQKAYLAHSSRGYDDLQLDKLNTSWEKNVTFIKPISKTTTQKKSSNANVRQNLMYAKGTMGTTHDQWAITDEPQFGDELVLIPGKDGNLSFMRKGTGVVPADLTQKLVELAQIPSSDLMNKNMTAIVPNITKNDFKNEFNFESLVHVDTVDSDTLPKLEKMVDKKIDDFSKALNYSLKRFAR